MGDRIVTRGDHLKHNNTLFEIDGGLYSAKTVGTDAWDIERVSMTPAGAKLTDEEKASVEASMVRLLEADELRGMQGG